MLSYWKSGFTPVLGLSYLWSLGSLIGIFLLSQITTGLFLCLYWTNSEVSFLSVVYLVMEPSNGWFFWLLHSNGASTFFFLVYLHVLKALFYSSWRLTMVWFSGLFLLFLLLAEAFLGYTLVWSQMSFWAGVVITSLLSVISSGLVLFLWGSYTLGGGLLKLFFVLHFLIPFLMLGVVLLHLVSLHFYGSTSKLGVSSSVLKYTFHPIYSTKDLLDLLVFGLFLVWVSAFPLKVAESLAFEEANSLVSPAHIVPEWYYLWAYGVLRAIPSKPLGVLALVLALFSLFLFLKSQGFSLMGLLNKRLVFFFLLNTFLLGWLGSQPAESPYVVISGWATVIYFLGVFSIWGLSLAPLSLK